jgi:transposase InsO family protein
MPWKEATPMSSRLEFILLVQQPGANVAALCRSFGVSRKTAYKWLERYRSDGENGLQDQSRKPHMSPTIASASLESAVLRLNEQYPCWGARKLRALLPPTLERPHHSTVGAILRRHERSVLGAPSKADSAPLRFEHDAPNLLWQMDFKGHFALTDSDAGRCYPLTVLDDHSRFNLCLTACANERRGAVQAALISTFEHYGLPQRITADNGNPWGTTGHGGISQLGVWLVRLGVRLSHSRPYHPQTQGKDERFHRTLKLELLERRGFNSLADCQSAFDVWRDRYNLIRPHEALDQKAPVTRYQASGRAYPAVLPVIEYDSGTLVRKVGNKGDIQYLAQRHFVSEGLRNEFVALKPTDTDGILDVYFCDYRIRQIDVRISA